MKKQARRAVILAFKNPIQNRWIQSTSNQRRRKSLLAVALLVLLAACKKDEIDPHQAILGKWEEFYVGNGESLPQFVPNSYMQFLRDSVLIEYRYDTQTTIQKQYWIDSLLHIGSASYSYQFNADTLQLYVEQSSAILYLSKHKRIN